VGFDVMLRHAGLMLPILLAIAVCGEQWDSSTGLRQVTIRVAHFGSVAQTEIFHDIIRESRSSWSGCRGSSIYRNS